jgi:hypothetical protein
MEKGIKIVRRINYYTRKVVQLGSVHPTRRDASWQCRSERLLKYKQAMNKVIKAE